MARNSHQIGVLFIRRGVTAGLMFLWIDVFGSNQNGIFPQRAEVDTHKEQDPLERDLIVPSHNIHSNPVEMTSSLIPQIIYFKYRLSISTSS